MNDIFTTVQKLLEAWKLLLLVFIGTTNSQERSIGHFHMSFTEIMYDVFDERTCNHRLLCNMKDITLVVCLWRPWVLCFVKHVKSRTWNSYLRPSSVTILNLNQGPAVWYISFSAITLRQITVQCLSSKVRIWWVGETSGFFWITVDKDVTYSWRKTIFLSNYV